MNAYRRALAFVFLAALAVAVAGVFVVHGFYLHITTACYGYLEPAPIPDHPTPAVETLDSKDSLSVEYDYENQYSVDMRVVNPHVVWGRADGQKTCNALPLPNALHAYAVSRDPETDTYVVTDTNLDVDKQRVTAFRTVDRGGRFYDHSGLPHLGDLPLIVLLVAAFGLIFAAGRLLGIRGYATRVHRWKACAVRLDGAVESESGELVGRLEARNRRSDEPVLVDPAKLERKGAYRDIPLLEKRDVVWGDHARWQKVTARAIRDVRMMAMLVVATSGAAVAAYQLAG